MAGLYRKVDFRLHGKGNSNTHGARPVNQIIKSMWWTRTSRLSIQNSLSHSTEPGLSILRQVNAYSHAGQPLTLHLEKGVRAARIRVFIPPEGLRVWGLGFRVEGSGFMVNGSGEGGVADQKLSMPPLDFRRTWKKTWMFFIARNLLS